MSKCCAIHQPQFVPWSGYFNKIALADVFVFLDNVQYKKNEFQNRNRIRTPAGPAWFSLPVHHHFGEQILAIQLVDSVPWQRKLRAKLQQSYSHAPFFAAYFPGIATILESAWPNLAAINIATVRWLCDVFGITTPLLVASELAKTNDDPTLRLVEICQQLEATDYLSGASGPEYMDLNLFSANNIGLYLQHFQQKPYPQIHGPDFVGNLSVLDLLFNVGPVGGRQLLLSSGQKEAYEN